MEDIKKPYECRFRNCSMSFVTKDHLDVHAQKHSLSLTLTPTTPFKNFVDETPTPTRFLKELESEVFQDLNGCNPFDATFRRANSSSGSNVFLIPESSSLIANLPDTEVLNTPSITLPSEPESPILFKTNFAKRKTQLKVTTDYSDNNDTLPFTTDDSTTVEQDPLPQNVVQCNLEEVHQGLSVETSTFLSSESAFLDDMQGDVLKTSTPSVQTPVITSIGHSSLLKTSTTGVPTAVVVNRPSVNPAQNLAPTTISVVPEKTSQEKTEQPQAVVQSVCVTPMMQVIIRLPDGQTMPIQFPVMSSVPTITNTPVPSTTPITTATPVVHSTQPTVQEPQIPVTTTTKMKLKEVLTLNQKSSPKNNSSPVKGRSKPLEIQPLLQEDMLAEFGISPPSSPTVQRPGHNGRKRRETSDHPDEKRKRSLERNRAAATRCREKRKVWITALERKADELENVNANLQHEVTQLRNEVAHLKTMLLAHKDCPVTLQQKGMVYADKKSYATVQIISHSTPEDLQTVPNSSPLNAEFMEVEISSVQSSSDASLTSDTSEASFKER